MRYTNRPLPYTLPICCMLQLNGDKTKLLWFSSTTHFHWPGPSRWTSVVQPVTVVRDLSVWIDWELSMRQHVSRVARTCFLPAPSTLCSSTTRPRCLCTTRHGPRTTWTTATLFLPVFQRQHWHHCRESSLVSRRTTSPICSHRSPTFSHVSHSASPQMEISFYRVLSGEPATAHFLSLHRVHAITSCMDLRQSWNSCDRQQLLLSAI